jgi:uncharacterized protein (UPF0335 family)
MTRPGLLTLAAEAAVIPAGLMVGLVWLTLLDVAATPDPREVPVMSETTETTETNNVGGIAAEQLRSFIQRIENLEEEKNNLSRDISDVYNEAKSAGFDTKIIRQLIRLRKMDRDDLAEQDSLLDLYRRAVNV